MGRKIKRISLRGHGELDQTRSRQNAEKRIAKRKLRGKTDEEIAASNDLSDLATLVGRKTGNKTGPRPQGLDKKGKRLKAYFGDDFVPRIKREGPNIDTKARRAKRTKRIHARGTDVVEALMHLEAPHRGKLVQEWKFRSAGGPTKMPHKTAENFRKLSRYFAKHADGLPDLPQTAVSKTAESLVLEHAWKKSGGNPVTVSIICIDNKNKDGRGPGRLLNQQECQGIERVTGHDPNALVDAYFYGDDDGFEYTLTEEP